MIPDESCQSAKGCDDQKIIKKRSLSSLTKYFKEKCSFNQANIESHFTIIQILGVKKVQQKYSIQILFWYGSSFLRKSKSS